MLSPLLKAVILLTISGAAHARPQANHEIGVGVLDDWVSSGNYLIYSCGSQARTVQSLLDFSYLYLQTAILSTSTPPYKAFFHSADPASVSTILTSMTLGINVTVSEHVSRRPTLVCVNERDEGLRSAWTLCRNHPKAVSAANPGVAMILLCPSFFELAAAPDVADCPMVNLAETRLVGSRGLMNKQYIFLVQELAKLYIPGTIGGEGTSVKDIPGENQCLGLPESQALRNPSSYAYYAGYVRAKCTDFPSRVPIQHYRNLLTVDEAGAANGTSVSTLEGNGGGNETSALTLSCVSNGTDSAPCPN